MKKPHESPRTLTILLTLKARRKPIFVCVNQPPQAGALVTHKALVFLKAATRRQCLTIAAYTLAAWLTFCGNTTSGNRSVDQVTSSLKLACSKPFQNPLVMGVFWLLLLGWRRTAKSKPRFRQAHQAKETLTILLGAATAAGKTRRNYGVFTLVAKHKDNRKRLQLKP